MKLLVLFCLTGLSLTFGQSAAAPDGTVGVTNVQGHQLMYRVMAGQAVAEGDIVVGASQEDAPAPAGSYHTNAMTIQGRQFLWPNGVIPYVINPSLPGADRVTSALQQWGDQTPVRFVPRNGQSDYVLFTREPNNGICMSNVGRLGGQQKVTLSDQCTAGSVLHEVGHVIGLFHEQSRPDRDDFVQVIPDNIDKLQLYQFASALPYGDSFQVGVGAGAYDYGSIMHYGPTGFSRTGGATTITIPPGIPIGQTSGLSAGDISGARRLYGVQSQGVVVTSNPPGLTINVDGQDVVTPQQLDWAVGSTHHVIASTQGSDTTRYVFGRWNGGTDAETDITVTSDMDVLTAHFIRQLKLVVTTSGGSGQVVADPPSEDGFYPSGTTISLQAIPDDGQDFQFWSGRNYFPMHGGGANPAVFTLYDENISYGASFSGTALTKFVSDIPGTQVVIDGTPRTLPYTAAWSAGSTHAYSIVNPLQYMGTGVIRRKFVGWSTGDGESQQITADGTPTTITARFVKQYFVGSGTNLAGAGAVQLSPSSPDGYYDEGATLQVRVLTNPGYQFLSWSGDLTSDSPLETISVNDEMAVLANLRRR